MSVKQINKVEPVSSFNLGEVWREWGKRPSVHESFDRPRQRTRNNDVIKKQLEFNEEVK